MKNTHTHKNAKGDQAVNIGCGVCACTQRRCDEQGDSILSFPVSAAQLLYKLLMQLHVCVMELVKKWKEAVSAFQLIFVPLSVLSTGPRTPVLFISSGHSQLVWHLLSENQHHPRSLVVLKTILSMRTVPIVGENDNLLECDHASHSKHMQSKNSNISTTNKNKHHNFCASL